MTKRTKSLKVLERENASLLTRLEEVTDVLAAIRTGAVDALVVEGPKGDQVFTLEGADFQYRTFVETMNEGAVTLATNGTIFYCNRYFADLVGTTLEQTLGRTFVDFVASFDRPEFHALMARGIDIDIRAELSLEQPDGMAVPVRLSAKHLSYNCSDYWCLVVTDLRRQKLHDALSESEERLRTLMGTLEQRVEERTKELVDSRERLRTLANELNLTEQRERKRVAGELHDHLAQLMVLAIMKMAQVKQEWELTRASNDEVNKVQELLVEGLNYTRTLVSDLFPPVLHNLGLLPALGWLAEQMQAHKLTVIVETPQVGDDLKLSEEQALLLFQSVRELLINIIKHSGTSEATISIAQRDGILRIEVSDRGKGFDVCAKTKGGSSTNFGLFSICERMQALGGGLELESAVDRGTKATLVLPLVSATAGSFMSNACNSELSASTVTPQSAASPISNHANFTVSTLRIHRVLLVDDHAMVRQGLRTMLESYAGIQIVGEASNGEEALVCIAAQQPTVVVMDINMPKMNGIEATEVIKNRYPQMNVIGLSVQSDEEIQQAMLKAGAAVLLNKEAAVEQLYQAIQAVGKDSEMRDLSNNTTGPLSERYGFNPFPLPDAHHLQL